jgi:hypothetical protein
MFRKVNIEKENGSKNGSADSNKHGNNIRRSLFRKDSLESIGLDIKSNDGSKVVDIDSEEGNSIETINPHSDLMDDLLEPTDIRRNVQINRQINEIKNNFLNPFQKVGEKSVLKPNLRELLHAKDILQKQEQELNFRELEQGKNHYMDISVS